MLDARVAVNGDGEREDLPVPSAEHDGGVAGGLEVQRQAAWPQR
jgi:hypothetical protein